MYALTKMSGARTMNAGYTEGTTLYSNQSFKAFPPKAKKYYRYSKSPGSYLCKRLPIEKQWLV